MRWYILKNRRFEGPFEEPEIRMGLQKGYWTSQDFALTEELLEREEFNYTTVAQVLGLSPKPSESESSSKAEPESGFEDKEEVTRLFEENLDAGDLLRKHDDFQQNPIPNYSESVQHTEQAFSSRSNAASPWLWFKIKWRYLVVGACAVFVLLFIFEDKGPKVSVSEAFGDRDTSPEVPTSNPQGPGKNNFFQKGTNNRVRNPSGRATGLKSPTIQARPQQIESRAPSSGQLVDDEAYATIPGQRKSIAPIQKNKRKTPGNEELSDDEDSDIRDPDSDEDVDQDEENLDAQDQNDVEDSQDVVD